MNIHAAETPEPHAPPTGEPETSPTPVVSVSQTVPPETLPKTGGMPWGIISVALVMLIVGVAIHLSMRRLRRNEH